MIVAASSEVTLPRIILAAVPDFDLGGIRVKPSRRQLCAPGEDCRDLEPRVMQVLVALAMARGAVVSRDQLIDSCWEGRIVGDDSLNRCVVALRRLAREIDPQPFAIETVARIGYCLMETQLAPPPVSAAAAGGRGAAAADAPASKPRRFAYAIVAGTLLAAAGALWLRPPAGESETIPRVRIAGFQTLSPDLPRTSGAAFQDELTATLGVEDPVMLVAAKRGGSAPDLALGGTVRKSGGLLQFTLHLRNERSGADLWSQSFEQPASFALAPRQVAATVSQVLRCGLAGAGPYLPKMSDGQLSLWLQFCQEVWSGGPSRHGRILDAARRVTAAAPDFSPGWSSLALYASPIEILRLEGDLAALRAESEAAASRALRLDPRNSEAYAAMASNWVDRHEWGEVERLLLKAISVRPTHCSCEHANYGWTLAVVGRLDEAAAQYRRYHDRQPLAYSSNFYLARALFLAGQNEEGEHRLADTIRLWPGTDGLLTLRLRRALWTGQYRDGAAALADPHFQSSPPQRAALAAAFHALGNRRPDSRRQAAEMLKALAHDPQRNTMTVTLALAAVGEPLAALESTDRNASWMLGTLFSPGFAEARRHPEFAVLVHKLGMVRYWRQSGRHPDFCKAADAPPLCKTL